MSPSYLVERTSAKSRAGYGNQNDSLTVRAYIKKLRFRGLPGAQLAYKNFLTQLKFSIFFWKKFFNFLKIFFSKIEIFFSQKIENLSWPKKFLKADLAIGRPPNRKILIFWLYWLLRDHLSLHIIYTWVYTRNPASRCNIAN